MCIQFAFNPWSVTIRKKIFKVSVSLILRYIDSCRGREVGKGETDKLSEKDKMLEEKEVEVCGVILFILTKTLTLDGEFSTCMKQIVTAVFRVATAKSAKSTCFLFFSFSYEECKRCLRKCSSK